MWHLPALLLSELISQLQWFPLNHLLPSTTKNYYRGLQSNEEIRQINKYRVARQTSHDNNFTGVVDVIMALLLFTGHKCLSPFAIT